MNFTTSQLKGIYYLKYYFNNLYILIMIQVSLLHALHAFVIYVTVKSVSYVYVFELTHYSL